MYLLLVVIKSLSFKVMKTICLSRPKVALTCRSTLGARDQGCTCTTCSPRNCAIPFNIYSSLYHAMLSSPYKASAAHVGLNLTLQSAVVPNGPSGQSQPEPSPGQSKATQERKMLGVTLDNNSVLPRYTECLRITACMIHNINLK